MTPEQILAVLRVEHLDEVGDALESELFEIRKAILAKPLLRLTLKSKLLRLKILADISSGSNSPFGEPVPIGTRREGQGGGKFPETEMPSFTYDLPGTTEVLGLWESYMKARSQWKMMVTQTQTPSGLAVVFEEGLKMETAFSERFIPVDWTDEEPVFGIEPDPMLIQNGLKKAAEKGWLTFSDLEKNKSELGKDLLLALKRLSLLPKYL